MYNILVFFHFLDRVKHPDRRGCQSEDDRTKIGESRGPSSYLDIKVLTECGQLAHIGIKGDDIDKYILFFGCRTIGDSQRISDSPIQVQRTQSYIHNRP